MIMEFEVTVDGRKYTVRFLERDGALFVEHERAKTAMRGETPLRSRVQRAQLDGGPVTFGYHRTKEGVQIVLAGVVYETVVADAQHARLSQISARRPGGGIVDVKAPMPGMVVAVKVNVGDPVRKNQSLLALHAMKLENDIRSPRDGVVQSIAVKPGDVLEKGVTMMKLGVARA